MTGKLITTTALVIISLAGSLCAQTKADKLFNISEKYIYNTHTAHLKDGAKMVIEMADVTDYTMIKNLDSIVRLVLHDIDFYKDSFTALENVRIDYVLEKDSDKTMLRFKKYHPDGDLFVKRNGELSRMKIEQDTIRIILRKPLLEHNSHMSFYDFPVQVTFLLNNYTDINDVLSDKGLVNQAIDTFAAASLPKVYDPNISEHRTTIDYYPYLAGRKLVKKDNDNDDERQATSRRK